MQKILGTFFYSTHKISTTLDVIINVILPRPGYQILPLFPLNPGSTEERVDNPKEQSNDNEIVHKESHLGRHFILLLHNRSRRLSHKK